MQLVLSDDALAFEDAYEWLVGGSGEPRIREHVEELVDLLEQNLAPTKRGRILELLGDTGDKRAIGPLSRDLAHSDKGVREWALLSLEQLPFTEAAEIATRYRNEHPEF